MKRLLSLLGVLLVAHVALLFVRPRGATPAPVGDAVDVGIVFDVGGRGDKSFNDGAYLGAERAERELGARVRFIEPGEGSDREAGLRLLAAEGMDIDVAEVERTLQISQAHVSLDAPMTPGEDNKLIDFLPDVAERSADAATMEHALTEGIETVFKSSLEARETVPAADRARVDALMKQLKELAAQAGSEILR